MNEPTDEFTNKPTNKPTSEKETGRIEAFSDGVFAIALTLLAIELKAPLLHSVNNASLTAALIERWPEYLAFVNSFASILLMWIKACYELGGYFCGHVCKCAAKSTPAMFLMRNGLLSPLT